jgi:hypothetical protein
MSIENNWIQENYKIFEESGEKIPSKSNFAKS